ncbi:S-adenosyl-L-methionine-dependent methyltransferase [Mycena floridula]|nr:S-adenosyl-L-methionine-dependent methyltransferase [Mycena floridula]
MSVHLPPVSRIDSHSDEENSSEDEDDQTWDDWMSDSEVQGCKSLFDDKVLKSAPEMLTYDKANHSFDLDQICKALSLDIHSRIRLINYIRKMKPSLDTLNAMNSRDPVFMSDEYLHPTLQDDPLLQYQPDDWSDDEDESESTDPLKRIKVLEKKLAQFADYRALLGQRLNLLNLVDEPVASPAVRDDDSHYFESYGENDIHAVMIQDQVRTSSYAQFIMKSPMLFRDAIVLDVGCGTGILSLFAAKAGAKRVIAVDASNIATKAAQIVKDNGLENTITVIQGKVEDIELPDGIKHVDIIISEWMGYALLYESMLDSVLIARDRFLRPDGDEGPGVMAPSQSRMMLSLCDASDLVKERISFWTDVYGFDLSAMASHIYDDGIVDVVGPDTLLSEPCVIKDLHLATVTTRGLNFSSPFTLVSTAERKTKMSAFLLYFDTFFSSVADKPLPETTKVKVIKTDDIVLAEVWPVGGRPAPLRRPSLGKEAEQVTSFSTGPQSIPTHWKQTLFLLRDPIVVEEGSIVQGTFHCRKSETNSRELDIEIHYSMRKEGEKPGDVVVQMFKVR